MDYSCVSGWIQGSCKPEFGFPTFWSPCIILIEYLCLVQKTEISQWICQVHRHTDLQNISQNTPGALSIHNLYMKCALRIFKTSTCFLPFQILAFGCRWHLRGRCTRDQMENCNIHHSLLFHSIALHACFLNHLFILLPPLITSDCRTTFHLLLLQHFILSSAHFMWS